MRVNLSTASLGPAPGQPPEHKFATETVQRVKVIIVHLFLRPMMNARINEEQN